MVAAQVATGITVVSSGARLSLLVAVLGALTLAEDIFTLELGIDQLVLADTAAPVSSGNPGRMAPATALNFLFIGSALLSFKAHQPRLAACAQWLATVPLFVSTLAIVGHAYGVSALYEVKPYSSMAVHTALAFFVLTPSLMAADPMHGIARIATSDTAGGLVCRRLLSTIPLILFAFGWVCLAGQRSGLYGTEFGLALMVLLGITVCVVAVASTADTLHKVDVTRKRADIEVALLNAELEQRVQERTQQLAQLSTEFKRRQQVARAAVPARRADESCQPAFLRYLSCRSGGHRAPAKAYSGPRHVRCGCLQGLQRSLWAPGRR